jgi:hypothetical protein
MLQLRGAMTRRAMMLVLWISCSHSPAAHEPMQPRPDEHWETVTVHRLASLERCGVGPYEVELPSRKEEWGRRIVFQVRGPRRLLIDTFVEGKGVDPGAPYDWQTGFGRMSREDGDHSRCRVGEGDTAVAPQRGGGRQDVGATPMTASDIHSQVKKIWADSPAVDLPKLVDRAGESDAPVVERAAMAWLPHGDPWYYADEYWTARTASQGGWTRIRIRFWMEHPSDLDGTVFELLDQRLVPDLPAAEYEPRFRARVAQADAQREASKPKPLACPTCAVEATNALAERCRKDRMADECKPFRQRNGRAPPPPRNELTPSSPGHGAEWLAGYWEWSEELADFVWIEGTFVVRARPQISVVTEASAPARPRVGTEPVPTLAPLPLEVDTIEPPREVQVEAPPPANVDVIVAPPAQVGVTWMPGHWELAGARWVWAAGRWVAPPPGTRYQRPVLQVNGSVRLYIPARWVRVR